MNFSSRDMLGKRNAPKLEEFRNCALARVRDQRMVFENMVLRCRAAGEIPNQDRIDEFVGAMDRCDERIRQGSTEAEFKEVIYQAETRGALRAYLCPIGELYIEASLSINQMEDWGVSPASLKPFRSLASERLTDVERNPNESRGALRAILRELNVSKTYTDEYENDLRRISRWLVVWVVVCFVAAVLAFHFRFTFFPLFAVSLFLAGAVGSCASVLARLPASEVSTSSASESLGRRTISRVGTGVVASIAGSALFAWGLLPIAINDVSFKDVLTACDPLSAGSCSSMYSLILLAVPIVLGFSERVLTTLDDKLFGKSKDETE
jgi:hypothetical protein